MASRDFDPAGSPLRVFGAELRYYRTRAGLSQEQLGIHVYCSGDLVGKIENGQRAPTQEFALACDTLPELDTRGALMRLWELLRDYLKYRAYPGWFHDWPGKEAEAKTLRTFELVYVPGLLQTEDYALALLRAEVMATEDEIADRVVARMERQAILDLDKPPMLWVIIDEEVLRRAVGGPAVMRDQLVRLAEAARRPNVVLQIVPAGVGAYEGMNGPFVIANFEDTSSVVYLETAAGGQIIEDATDVAAVTVRWDTIRAEALPRASSLDFLEEVAKIWT
jgi:transcriptional regulator with XRE-family HTH domain